MRFSHPLLAATALFVAFAFASSNALAQGGPPGDMGPPPWAGDPNPPPFAGPPDDPGPPDNPGPPGRGGNDDDDDDDDDDDGNGIPDFCSAGGPNPGGPSGQAGMSSIAHLNFSQLESETGAPDSDAPWGRMMYRWMAPLFDYVFNAHQLEPGDEWTLTYQPQPLPSDGVICLGTGTVNDEGDLHLQDAFDIATDLPAAYDENEDVAILALVFAADVDCDTGDMINWTEDDYLFGEEGMFYVHSDLDEDEEEDEDNQDNGDD